MIAFFAILATCAALVSAVPPTARPGDELRAELAQSPAALDFTQVIANDPLESLLRAEPVELVFALRRSDAQAEALQERFQAVSDPKSESYRHYMSPEEIKAAFAPSDESVDGVRSWVEAHGGRVVRTALTGDFLKVQLPHRKAVEQLLQITYELRADGADETRRVLASLDTPSVPARLAETVELVGGAVGVPARVGEQPVLEVDAMPEGTPSTITPPIIRTAYNVTEGFVVTHGSTQGVAEFGGQYYKPSDLQSFFQQFVKTGTNMFNLTTDYNNNPDAPAGVESSLDIDAIMGTAVGSQTSFIYIDGSDVDTMFITWGEFVMNLNSSAMPLVHSVSYGTQGVTRGGVPSKSVQERNEQEFAKMALRGITVLFASGDEGSGCSVTSLCKFEPSYPASSPSVTAVGAINPDGVTAATFSGGGFSFDFNRNSTASWQDDAVSAYLASGVKLPRSSSYNAQGRATPDVSAFGVAFSVVANGGVQKVSGTSAASPTFAGILTIVNDHLLAAGQAPLGFVNPFLYGNTAAFNDITEGSNKRGASCLLCLEETGYPTAKGWDPVSGLGTPNTGKLIEAALQAGGNTKRPAWM